MENDRVEGPGSVVENGRNNVIKEDEGSIQGDKGDVSGKHYVTLKNFLLSTEYSEEMSFERSPR